VSKILQKDFNTFCYPSPKYMGRIRFYQER